MSEDRNKKVIPAEGGIFDDVWLYMRLVVRLLMDPRVNIFLKMLPIGSLIYLLFPLDFPGPIDDLAVLGVGMFMFIELCPPEIVDEHKHALQGYFPGPVGSGQQDSDPEFSEDDVIEAEYREE
ncbi:MAG: YkvA family protein [Anaerolineales bacterium]|jgi:hypothetical protein